jgi:hypothetical protein
VAVLGGTLIANFLNFNEANFAGVFNAIGEAFLVAGKSWLFYDQAVADPEKMAMTLKGDGRLVFAIYTLLGTKRLPSILKDGSEMHNPCLVPTHGPYARTSACSHVRATGGTAIYTGVSFNEWSANLFQSGTGCFTVAMGRCTVLYTQMMLGHVHLCVSRRYQALLLCMPLRLSSRRLLCTRVPCCL